MMAMPPLPPILRIRLKMLVELPIFSAGMRAMAWPSRSLGKVSSRIAWAGGCRPRPVSPCKMRKVIHCGSEVAKPRSSDVRVNPATQVSSRRFAAHIVRQPA